MTVPLYACPLGSHLLVVMTHGSVWLATLQQVRHIHCPGLACSPEPAIDKRALGLITWQILRVWCCGVVCRQEMWLLCGSHQWLCHVM